jgi:rhodanese-related sulfurtransferase
MRYNGKMMRLVLSAIIVVSLLAGIYFFSSCSSTPSGPAKPVPTVTAPALSATPLATPITPIPATASPPSTGSPVSSPTLTSAASPVAKQEFLDLSAKQAYVLIEQNKGNAGFIILDVRTPQEFAEGHLANAVNVDFNATGFNTEMSKLDKEMTYLVYCRAGNRSRGALEVMKKLDFPRVYHLVNGIVEWQNEGLPVLK